MKKISTVAAKATKNFSQPKLTIGLDLGDRSSWYCLLDEVGEVLQEQKLSTTPKAMREVFGSHAALSHRAGDRDAFAVGEPVVERVGARSNRGACPQRWKQRSKIRWQHRLKREHPTCTERKQNRSPRVRMEG